MNCLLVKAQHPSGLRERKSILRKGCLPATVAELMFCLVFVRVPPAFCSPQNQQSSDTGALADQAQDALQRQDYPKAIEYYKRLIQLVGPNAELLSNLGVAYHMDGELHLARDTFLKALSHDSQLVTPKLFLGIEYNLLSSPQEAIRYLSQFVQLRPDDSNARKWLAKSYGDLGDYLASTAQLREALERTPGDSEMLYLLGENYLKLSGSETARLAQVAPASYLTLLIRAETSTSEGDQDDALAYYRDVLALNANSTDADLRIAKILSARGDTDGAITACGRALQENPDDPDANLIIAKLLSRQGRFEAMAPYLDRLAYLGRSANPDFRELTSRTGPEHPSRMPPESESATCNGLESCQNQADTFAGRSHFEAARQSLVNARQFGSLGAGASLLLARCEFRTRRYSDVVHTVAGDRTKQRLSGEMLILLGRSYLELDEPTSAAKTFAQIQPYSDRFPEALYFLYESYGRLAHNTFDRLAALDPDSCWTHMVIAESFAARNDILSAVNEYNKVLQIKPDAPLIHLAMGNLYWKHFEDDKALEQYKVEFEANPYNAVVNFALGRAYLAQRYPEQALPYLVTSVKVDPSLADAQLDLGKAYLLLNQPAKAVPALETCVHLTPKNKVGHFKLSQAYREMGLKAKADTQMAMFVRLDEATRKTSVQKADRMRAIEDAERNATDSERTVSALPR